MKLRTSRACAPLVAALLLAGCAAPAAMPVAPAVRSDAGSGRAPAKASAERGELVSSGGGTVAAPAAAPVAAGGRAEASADAGFVAREGAAEAPVAMVPLVDGASVVARSAGPGQVSASDLKAGSVDDNEGFRAYLEYLADFDWGAVGMAPRRLDVSRRKVLTVVDAAGKPVHDAQVQVRALGAPVTPREPSGQPEAAAERAVTVLRTYADGRALYHPQPDALPEGVTEVDVTATKGGLSVTGKLALDAEALTLKLPEVVEPVVTGAPLDVAFVLDATGSMGGEIRRFQATMGSIAERIKMLPQAPRVRFALVSYRDQGEAYVTNVENFTAAIGEFQARLNEVSASGGGDKPEDMEAALRDTVNTLAWTPDGAVRLSFVVADAAPHTDYAQSTPYTASMASAAAGGIKFYPIGASSLEKEGEYVMRQLAQWTMGQYLFVTRGGDEASGGGGTASAEVDKFKEGRLDDIVVDIVKAELSRLGQ
ncbi:MAG: vWA domain-containing protein [Candidatus Sericytochromatia bacterium]|nr:vWA domain-containing protein [Candidatus Sericytochromatia bacterium]